MPRLFALAYPTLCASDAAWIESVRQRWDLPHRDLVDAHITLVFGTQALRPVDFSDHVAGVAKTMAPVGFTCRHAMLGVDDAGPEGHVFLVPDEGNSAIARLHDRLYAGALRRELRLDIPYIPHITLGTLPTLEEARRLCDALNCSAWSIEGRIEAITVVELHVDHVETRARYPLTGNAAAPAPLPTVPEGLKPE